MARRLAHSGFSQHHTTALLSMAILFASVPWGVQGGKRVPKPVAKEGKLMFKDAHVREIWTLVTSGDGLVYRLPSQPLDSTGRPIPPTNTISLDCTVDPEVDTICTKISNAEITKAAAAVKSTALSLNLLVMVVSLTDGSCAARPGANLAAVRTAFSSGLGYSNFLRNCSYGKVVYNRVTVINTPVACTPLINRCDEDSIAEAAKQSAADQYGEVFVASFSRFSYVLPIDMVATCGWVGLAELPGTQTWYTSDSEGVFNKGTVLQESLHNLAIYHGWRYGVEYEDNSTSMGMGNSCPSAPELWRLGWASVLSLLNSKTFPARTFRTFTLPATYLGPDKNMIKIQPDWLDRKYRRNVYLALRVKAGGDRDLEQEFDGRINVHEVNKDIDNNFNARGDPRVSILGTVKPFDTVDITPYKLVVRTEALVDDHITIKICRYDTKSSDCAEAKATKPARRMRMRSSA